MIFTFAPVLLAGLGEVAASPCPQVTLQGGTRQARAGPEPGCPPGRPPPAGGREAGPAGPGLRSGGSGGHQGHPAEGFPRGVHGEARGRALVSPWKPGQRASLAGGGGRRRPAAGGVVLESLLRRREMKTHPETGVEAPPTEGCRGGGSPGRPVQAAPVGACGSAERKPGGRWVPTPRPGQRDGPAPQLLAVVNTRCVTAREGFTVRGTDDTCNVF